VRDGLLRRHLTTLPWTRVVQARTLVGPTWRASQRASAERGGLPLRGQALWTFPPTRCGVGLLLWAVVVEANAGVALSASVQLIATVARTAVDLNRLIARQRSRLP
jgi:hypothetical protein